MTTAFDLRRPEWVEFGVLMVLSWGALAAIPVALGGIGISWDALNHQIYLGWIANEARFDRDFMPAASQSVQYPYLYWPVFLLARAEVSGVAAGVVLATLNWTAAPPVWLVSRMLITGSDAYSVAMRAMAVILAFLSPVALSLFDSTSNDLLATVPLLWGVTLALAAQTYAARATCLNLVAASGVLAGVSIAFKLSNGPLALVLPLLWAWTPGAWSSRLRTVALGSACVVGASVFTYLPWGILVWDHLGNPIYPFCDACFVPLRSLLDWNP